MLINFDGTFAKSLIIASYTVLGGSSVAIVRHFLTKSSSNFNMFTTALDKKADKIDMEKLEISVTENFEKIISSDSKFRARIDNEISELETKLEQSIEFNYDKIEAQIKEQGIKTAEQFGTINSQAHKTEKVLTFLVLANKGTASDLKDLGLT